MLTAVRVTGFYQRVLGQVQWFFDACTAFDPPGAGSLACALSVGVGFLKEHHGPQAQNFYCQD
jgi:hypothetical protein